MQLPLLPEQIFSSQIHPSIWIQNNILNCWYKIEILMGNHCSNNLQVTKWHFAGHHIESMHLLVAEKLKISFETHFVRLTCVTSCVYIIGVIFTRGADIYDILEARFERYLRYRAQELGQSRHYQYSRSSFQLFAPFLICLFSWNRCLHGGAHVYSIKAGGGLQR